jgi:hypothetical protein
MVDLIEEPKGSRTTAIDPTMKKVRQLFFPAESEISPWIMSEAFG